MPEEDKPAQDEITFRKGEKVSYKNPYIYISPVSPTVSVVNTGIPFEVYSLSKLYNKSGELQTTRDCLYAIVSKLPNNPPYNNFDGSQRQIELLEAAFFSNEQN